jgi:hypothetical protein
MTMTIDVIGRSMKHAQSSPHRFFAVFDEAVEYDCALRYLVLANALEERRIPRRLWSGRGVVLDGRDREWRLPRQRFFRRRPAIFPSPQLGRYGIQATNCDYAWFLMRRRILQLRRVNYLSPQPRRQWSEESDHEMTDVGQPGRGWSNATLPADLPCGRFSSFR